MYPQAIWRTKKHLVGSVCRRLFQVVVALAVRSHRKRLLTEDDKLYVALNSQERRRVDVLGAILRLADGFDRSHCGLVRDVECRSDGDCLMIYCHGETEPNQEMAAALKKSNLFTRTFGKNIKIEFCPNNTQMKN